MLHSVPKPGVYFSKDSLTGLEGGLADREETIEKYEESSDEILSDSIKHAPPGVESGEHPAGPLATEVFSDR